MNMREEKMRTEEENKKIIDEYPFLRYMRWDRNTRTYKWNYKATILDIEIPEGWEDLILCMAEDIKPLLEESGQLYDFFAEQAKEKFGELRFYHNNKCPEEVDRIIDDYSALSGNVCWICGKPDVPHLYDGWEEPWCRDCYKNKEFWDEVNNDPEVSNKMADTRSWRIFSKDEDGTKIYSRDISDKAQKIRKRYAERINK